MLNKFIKINFPSLLNVVDSFHFQFDTIVEKQNLLEIGCTLWCFYEMERITLLDDCKRECILKKKQQQKKEDLCTTCKIPLYNNMKEAHKVCKTCGKTYNLNSEFTTINEKTNYTWQRMRHHYDHREHFAQTINDFTNIGNRNVPPEVMKYCMVVLGRGLHVTSSDVYNVLKSNGYRSYYQYKYEIANYLRGKPEFIVTSLEITKMKTMFQRYSKDIIPFQRNVLKLNSQKKMRILWPMRFILAEICKEIEREDLIKYIRKISCKKRYEYYLKTWQLFVQYVDDRYPRPTWTHVNNSIQLKKTKTLY